MSLILEIVFWCCVGCILYVYGGYFGILYILTRNKKLPDSDQLSAMQPAVNMIIAAYNEENNLPMKIDNCRRINYPPEQLKIFIGSDGSSDKTNTILDNLQDPLFNTAVFDERRGKIPVLNDLVQHSDADILVFSDANTIYHPDAVTHLVKHFQDPSVGAVCGRILFVIPRFIQNSWDEMPYWQYEVRLKYMEGLLGLTSGAAGGMYAIRRTLFEMFPLDIQVIDDMFPVLQVAHKRYRVLFEPEAIALEAMTLSLADEFKRKVRIATQNFSALPNILKFCTWKNPGQCWIIVSHKILRWIVPGAMLGAISANILLVQQRLYLWLLLGQAVFYGCALTGYFMRRYDKKIVFLSYPYYFLVANLAIVVGWFKSFTQRQILYWETGSRQVKRDNSNENDPGI